MKTNYKMNMRDKKVVNRIKYDTYDGTYIIDLQDQPPTAHFIGDDINAFVATVVIFICTI